MASLGSLSTGRGLMGKVALGRESPSRSLRGALPARRAPKPSAPMASIGASASGLSGACYPQKFGLSSPTLAAPRPRGPGAPSRKPSHVPQAASMAALTASGVTTAIRQGLTGALAAFLIGLKNFLVSVNHVINDPWTAEEVWVIVLYFTALKPVLQCAYMGWRLVTTGSQKYTQSQFTESFFGFLYGPLRLLGYCLAFNWIFDVMCAVLELAGINMAELGPTNGILQGVNINVDQTIYVAWLGYSLYRFQYYYLDEFMDFLKGGETDVGVLDLLHRCCEVVIFSSTALAMLSSMGMPPSSLGWLSGMFGLGFGFASQEVVQNFLGGVMIALLRPFSVGDKISVSNEMIESTVSGVVQNMGYYQTVLFKTVEEGEEGGVMYIPNQWFVKSDIINHSRTPDYFTKNPRRKPGYY